MRELAGTRQVKIVEPRQPEAQRRGAQQRGPRLAFVVVERTNLVIRTQHCRDESAVLRDGVAIEAPIVDGDGEVVREKIGGGKTEVDDAGNAWPREQHVVAKKIAV